MAKSAFTAVLSVIDRVSAPLKKLERSFRPFKRAFKDIGSASSQLTSTLGSIIAPLGAIFGAAGLGGIAALGTKIIGTSAQFERFQTILETVEGSSEKAKASMDWVSRFATDTPYELAEVTDAFVKLKAYGIDPQAGALASAGDAAAAMGKPLGQAVEAIADLMTGETERMKEFGMTFRTEGDKLVYRWDENGKKMVVAADKNSKAQIEAMVKGLWNSRYGGAGAKLATTWDGLWSNMMDGVTRFFKAIGDAGIFEFMKEQLVGVLATMKRMEADGSLQALAKTISDELVGAFKELKSWFEGIDWAGVWSDLKGFAGAVRQLVVDMGGLKGIGIGIAVLFGVQLLSSIAVLASSFLTLGLAMGPVSWGLLAIGAAAFIIYDNWDGIVEFFTGKFDRIKDAFGNGFLGGMATLFKELNPFTLITEAIDGLVKYLTGVDLGSLVGDQFRKIGNALPKWAQEQLGFSESAVPDQPLAGLGGQAETPLYGVPKGGLLNSARQNLQGNLTVSFENSPAGMKVAGGKTNQPGVAMEADVGYRSLAMP
ncbi:tape measure protein [Pseudomonas anguilliseptica]|uniref:tape measure protein n=1 Tax=Pseudomonas anguilliseptica TaxID=53406 RepID=UPI00325B3B39